MSTRWAAALSDLEQSIERARAKGGDYAARAVRAADLALVAAEIIPRVERAAKRVEELQVKVDGLDDAGRDFRASIGHALDVLVHDRSRERARIDALRARRQALEGAIAKGASKTAPTNDDPRRWEIDSLLAEEKRGAGIVEDLGFQVDALQSQLDAKNQAFERDLLEATGRLEGSLTALRHMTGEVVRAIDDGIHLLEA